MDVIPVMKPWLGDEEARAAADVLASGWVAQGPRVAEFERRLADHVGAAEGVAVSSCTAGLHLALHALGVGPGDEVIVPSLSFIATANAPRYVGATPVFADVDVTTQNLTPDTIEAAMTPATRAVVLVHQVGMPADIDAIRAVCEPRGVAIVEDAACAIDSTYRGSPIGSHSELVVFSFHPRKILTTGEGGMITTPNAALATRLRALRQHAMSRSAYERHAGGGVDFEEYPELGFNYRMTDIQAAIGIVQLAKTPEMVERRRALAASYREALASLPVTLPDDPEYGTTNFQSYSIVLESGVDRDDVLRRLGEQGISARRGVMAAHREPTFADHPHGPLPNTESLADRALILPLFHQMTPEEQDRVVDAVAEAIQPT